MKINDVKLGPTGRHPQGKVDPSDEGELTLAVAVDYEQAIVRIEFGGPVAWLGLPAGDARAFGQMLIDKADELDRRQT